MNNEDREDVRLLKSSEELWAAAQEVLRKKLAEPSFEMWIRPTQLLAFESGEATVGVSNEFMRGMISNHHLDSIKAALEQIVKEPVSVKIVVDTSILTDSYAPTIASISILPVSEFTDSNTATSGGAYSSPPPPDVSNQAAVNKANLGNKYTFNTFVVGNNNRFCHSAALAVAAKPGQSYNPLFLYGGVGLGKTHIMQAIGHEILRSSPHLSVRYISCERFTNELINSIRDDRMSEFRKRYRQLDVLLMDDIQFIQGKESTQEEFFHTFNTLRDSNKQIVLSSDRPPKAISLLEERLRSRFEWGLIADLQAPDLETRVAILRKKSQSENLALPDDVLQYIASIFSTNIRELEGALIRAHAFAKMMGSDLTVAALQEIIHPNEPSRPKLDLTLDLIIEAVAEHYRIEESEMRSTKRSQDLALPRHVAMYLAHELIQLSFPRIGQAFANRKHTSALYAYSRIKEALPKDPELAAAVKTITRKLTA
jgi:chromosomal replication initiator protein